MLEEITQYLRSLFNTPDRASAEAYMKKVVAKYEPLSSKLVSWMESNIPGGFSFFAFLFEHSRRIRTTHVLEQVNQGNRRRIRVVNIFPNEQACLRLVRAIQMETDEEWQTGKCDLSFKGSDFPKCT